MITGPGMCRLTLNIQNILMSKNVQDVVLLALDNIASSQRRYEESLQMGSRAHDILKVTSPNSETMAIGRQ